MWSNKIKHLLTRGRSISSYTLVTVNKWLIIRSLIYIVVRTKLFQIIIIIISYYHRCLHQYIDPYFSLSGCNNNHNGTVSFIRTYTTARYVCTHTHATSIQLALVQVPTTIASVWCILCFQIN